MGPVEQPSTTDDYATRSAIPGQERPPPADASTPLAEWSAAGRRTFRPLHFHAKGGLGEVFVAEDSELQRKVALKRMQQPYADNPEQRLRFIREAEITGLLEHPGIVPVYGLVQDADGNPCYAMRFIQGDTLQDAVARFHQSLPDQAAAGVLSGNRAVEFRQLLSRLIAVCNTIAYAHNRGIVHRDLKPANIMLGKYGETMVVDWGLAKRVDRDPQARASGEETVLPQADGSTEETRQGEIKGTVAFMSPEQASGFQDEIGPASDVFGLGATLYNLLVGRPPYQGANQP